MGVRFFGKKDMAMNLTVRMTLRHDHKQTEEHHHVLLGRHAITGLADCTSNSISLVGRGTGELSEKQRQLVSILELIRIESLSGRSGSWRGRPEKRSRQIARGFVAKAVYNMATTRQLLERLGAMRGCADCVVGSASTSYQ